MAGEISDGGVRRGLSELGPYHRRSGSSRAARAATMARRGRARAGGCRLSAGGYTVAALISHLKLWPSPTENSIAGRAFVFAGFAIAVDAVAIYGQDYVIPVVGLVAAAFGHVVSYGERAGRRG